MERIIWGVPSFWIERFPLYYGRKQGFFAERGIDLEIRYYWGGPQLAAAVSKGEVWIGEMGLPPFLTACSDGLPAQAVGSSTVRQLDHYLVARPGISKMTDLRGRRIGILSAGSCDDYFARSMLQASGLDPDTDVTLVPLGTAYGDMRCFSPSPVSGIPGVEAGFLVEPFVARAERLGRVRIVAVVRDYFPRYQWGIILARSDALERKIDLIHRAIDGFRREPRRGCLLRGSGVSDSQGGFPPCPYAGSGALGARCQARCWRNGELPADPERDGLRTGRSVARRQDPPAVKQRSGACLEKFSERSGESAWFIK
jgi:hypothetical protein